MIKVIKLKKIIQMLILIVIFFVFLVLIFNKNETVLTSKKIEEKYKILVDVEESKLYLFENEILINTYKCSGGKWSTPSPIGTWTIISKAKWGEGFGGSWMGINVPWGQFGIHGNIDKSSVGWASSHRLY